MHKQQLIRVPLQKYICLGMLLYGAVFPNKLKATERPADVPQQAAIVEHLDTTIDLSLEFTRQDGKKIRLSELFIDQRPLILAPVYYECPRLCTLTQEGIVKALSGVDLRLGTDYKVVSLSFNHRESSELAAKRRTRYASLLKENGISEDGDGWDFLVGSEENIRELMKEIGFSFEKDQGEFIHAAMFLVLTPEGKISRYFYGVNYPAHEIRFALVDAARGKIGNTLDQVMLFCFRFDPSKGKYTLAVWNLTRAFCLSGLAVLVIFLIRMRLQEKRRYS